MQKERHPYSRRRGNEAEELNRPKAFDVRREPDWPDEMNGRKEKALHEAEETRQKRQVEEQRQLMMTDWRNFGSIFQTETYPAI